MEQKVESRDGADTKSDIQYSDVAAMELGSMEVLGPEDEKKLIRKIDLHLMPILIVSYGLQYLDKTSLAYSAILGLREELNLVGQQYSWTSSVFYIGYLVATYPISLGFVKFPLGKYLGSP